MNKNAPYYQQMMHWYAHRPLPPGQPGHQVQPGVQPPLMGPAQLPAHGQPAQNSGILGSNFVKGAAIGAVVAYILTNDKVQQAAIKTAVKSWSLVQGGVEEMKERIRDAEAELHAADLDD